MSTPVMLSQLQHCHVDISNILGPYLGRIYSDGLEKASPNYQVLGPLPRVHRKCYVILR